MQLLGHSYKSKQFFFALLKLCIVLLAFYSIWVKFAGQSNLANLKFIDHSLKSGAFTIGNSSVIIALSILNWTFEIIKWKTLVSSIKEITFFQSMKESLGALTTSIMTPNRIGEYGAKAFFYASGQRMKIVFLNFIGNMTQLATTLIFGIIGFILINKKLNWNFPKIDLSYAISSLILIGILGLLFFKKRDVSIKGYSLNRLIAFVKTIDRTSIVKAQLFAFTRYFIFSFQMVILFQLMGLQLNYLELMPIIASMYVLSSILPSVVIFDVIVKGSIAVYLFELFGVPETTTVTVVMLMWLLNMVIPSIIGSYFVLSFKPIPKTI